MPLSNRDIRAEIARGGLKFDPPIEDSQFSSSSVDLRLGNAFTTANKPEPGVSIAVDPSQTSPERVMSVYGERVVIPSGEMFRLEPGAFVLGYTLESVELPNYLSARIEGKSSLARFGVSVHQTAPTVHAGFSGQLRLEISNIGPFTILLEPGTLFCQLIVENLSSPAEGADESQYQGQAGDG